MLTLGFDAEELDDEELDAEELDDDALAPAEADALAEVDVPTLGLTDVMAVGLGLWQVGPVAGVVAPCVFLLVALVLAAEAVEAVLLVALRVGLALPGPLVVTLGLALLLVGLPVGLALVLPLDGLVGVPSGVGCGVAAKLLAFGTADDEEADEHTIAVGLSRWVVAPPGLAPLVSEPAWLAEPFRLGGRPGALLVLKPSPEPIWSSASCSGGTARAMPMTNTAQAIATAGRISHSRQPRAGRRG